MASYAAIHNVDALLPGISLSETSTPSNGDVTKWLNQGYAVINRKLTAAGYSTPVSSSAAVYDEMTALNALYAAAQALRARGLDSVQGNEETRSERWLREFTEQIKELCASDLTNSGVSRLSSSSATRRGIRTAQLRRVDGYSGTFEGDYTDDYDYVSE